MRFNQRKFSLRSLPRNFYPEFNLVPRVSHLPAPWSERGESGKMRDPGNEVVLNYGSLVRATNFTKPVQLTLDNSSALRKLLRDFTSMKSVKRCNVHLVSYSTILELSWLSEIPLFSQLDLVQQAFSWFLVYLHQAPQTSLFLGQQSLPPG